MKLFKRTRYKILDPLPVNTRHGVATPTLAKVKGTRVEIIFLIGDERYEE